LGAIYYCEVTNDPNIITQESAQIGSITGEHQVSKSNDNVNAFHVVEKTLNYFPKGLDLYFKRLQAILIWTCKLKQIRQSDLKPFTELFYIYLKSNQIQVIEAGLFNFNPKLEFFEFHESNIIHIDPNVFDNLSKLRYLLLKPVNCIQIDVSNSREKVQTAIQKIKQQCVNLDFVDLNNKISTLEIELQTLNTEAFKTNIENFEKILQKSKFSEFENFSEKLERLRIVSNENTTNTTSVSSTTQQPVTQLTSRIQINGPTTENSINFLSNDVKLLSTKLDDLKSSQCGAKNSFAEIKSSNAKLDKFLSSQNEIGNTCNGIKLTLSKFEVGISQLQSSQDQFKNSMANSISTVNDKVNDLISWQNQSDSKLNDNQATQARIFEASITDSIDKLTSKFNDHKSKAEFSQDELKGKISEMEASISNVKASQNEVKSSLIKLRTSQNEIKIVLDELKAGNTESFVDKLESLEGHFMEFKNENLEKFDKIEKELSSTRHKISMSFDDKVKGIEKRLMKKFEEILEEKLRKILDEKLGKI